MQAYGGFEPAEPEPANFEPGVGEIRAMRSFRIGDDGALYPLFHDAPWSDGANTATCRSVRSQLTSGRSPIMPGRAKDPPHRAPEPSCSCGFYAYATADAAAEYPHSRNVLAVVACWGRVVVGTLGIRAEQARIEAVWTSDRVPAELAAKVTARYPGASMYTDRAQMLLEHPPSQLDCYQVPTPRETRLRRIAMRLAIVATLLVGLLPANWLLHNRDAHLVWITELILCAAGAVAMHFSRRDQKARRARLYLVAMTLWLIAPFGGGAGILLFRVPIVQIVLLTAVYRARLVRSANSFPSDIRLRTL